MNAIVIGVIVVVLILLGGLVWWFWPAANGGSVQPLDDSDAQYTPSDLPNGGVNTGYTGPSTPAGGVWRYLFSTGAASAGDKIIGKVGVIAHKRGGLVSKFERGASYNDEWQWIHPTLVLADVSKGVGAPYYALSAQMAESNAIGLLSNKQAPVSQFAPGGAYNADWNWTHPALVPAAQASHTIGVEGGPVTGILLAVDARDKVPFSPGAQLNTSWWWYHPRVVTLQ